MPNSCTLQTTCSRHDIQDLKIILSTLTDTSLTNQALDQWLVPLTRKVSLNLKMNRSDFRNAIQKQHTILLSAIVLLSVIVNYKLQCLVPRRLKCNDLEKLLKIILVSFLTKTSTDPLSSLKEYTTKTTLKIEQFDWKELIFA